MTTDLPLRPDRPGDDLLGHRLLHDLQEVRGELPGQSIPFGDREPSTAAGAGRSTPDSCFRYWNAIGTDCGRCMTVCPYSHPDNCGPQPRALGDPLLGRRAAGALWLDDLFYGRRPKPLPPEAS